MNESDLLLVLGASFSNHTGITPKKPTIQVDFDPMALGKFHAVDVPVWGEIGVTVAAAPRAARRAGAQADGPDARRSPSAGRIWREEKERRVADDRGQGI